MSLAPAWATLRGRRRTASIACRTAGDPADEVADIFVVGVPFSVPQPDEPAGVPAVTAFLPSIRGEHPG